MLFCAVLVPSGESSLQTTSGNLLDFNSSQQCIDPSSKKTMQSSISFFCGKTMVSQHKTPTSILISWITFVFYNTPTRTRTWTPKLLWKQCADIVTSVEYVKGILVVLAETSLELTLQWPLTVNVTSVVWGRKYLRIMQQLQELL